MIFSKILIEYFIHFRIIFKLLNVKNITLSIKKSFIDYLTITLLKQRINTFNLLIAIEKINVIKRIIFLYILIDLKLYLKLIEYLRIYVFYYVQKIDAL